MASGTTGAGGDYDLSDPLGSFLDVVRRVVLRPAVFFAGLALVRLTLRSGYLAQAPGVDQTVAFGIDPDSEDDSYGRLFGDDVVTTVSTLTGCRAFRRTRSTGWSSAAASSTGSPWT